MLLHHGHNTKGFMLEVRKRGTSGGQRRWFLLFFSRGDPRIQICAKAGASRPVVIHPARSGLLVEYRANRVLSDAIAISKTSPTNSKSINRTPRTLSFKMLGASVSGIVQSQTKESEVRADQLTQVAPVGGISSPLALRSNPFALPLLSHN